ncbi:MAG: hypothetical protein BGO43_00610 [Gammaproteobacteria bacterium 39-13]|nr:MFS transporter [Gammaproteobacteria bacterium]OJV96811.1 MAG: hypothetical protein BGO43_00610 [Gammaproteobacteria bacterium 39-13]
MFILLLLISFASVNAVLFTPALPNMVDYFGISESAGQLSVTTFLAGYAIGQLLYGPLSNRYGRKCAIYIGVVIQIFSSLFCITAGLFHNYALLVVARFFLAVGAGGGLKITITMVNETYPPQIASQKISLLMLAFAITPGLGVALGGVLNSYFGWLSCFYACCVYGLLLLGLISQLPETQFLRNLSALKPRYLVKVYAHEFSNAKIIAGGFLVGMCSCFIYLFATLSPFIAINQAGMSSVDYGFANLIPMVGLALGSLISAKLTKYFPVLSILKIGITITILGVVLAGFFTYVQYPILISLFVPMMIINMGEVMILANASSRAICFAQDKAHGASVINFIAITLATITVLSAGTFNITAIVLPGLYAILCIITMIMYGVLK